MAEVVARVGLISDTHSVFDWRAEAALRGVDAILHAGDICAARVLLDLEAIAPVTAVLGNCDWDLKYDPYWRLDYVAQTTIAGVRFLVVHDFADLAGIPDGVDVVVCGHSHAPRNEWHGTTLVVNPGSASQRRRQPSRSVAILDIAEDRSVEFRLVELDDIGEQP